MLLDRFLKMISKIFLIFILFCQYSLCWDLNKINPYCLINSCEDKQQENPSSLSWFKNNGPHCLIYNCEHKSEEKESSSSWNPLCWFEDCKVTSPKFLSYDYWTNEKDSKTFTEKISCIFKDCPDPELEKKKMEQQGSHFSRMYNFAVEYLNAAKPQETVINNIFTSELNPYCWMTECCNENSLPGNIEKLAALISSRLYGQNLVSTIVDAIRSHWSNPSRKALVLSFHGPVGTGKNYVCEMIANSLYKLGAKSKYVHHFSGRLHFTLQSNSNSYTENLYSWLKGNVTTCNKQLIIFDEADHMPAQVLNGILPMLDYREKVDGADYRNAIFIFLSNAGSDLILHRVNELYQRNYSRNELEASHFERQIVTGIFNQEGGFYHSDTISHNLIDHYIPFLPMEEKHVRECIMFAFRERDVSEPSEQHVKEILDSISWGETETLMYAKTGCKSVGAKVSFLCEKYYKSIQKEQTEL